MVERISFVLTSSPLTILLSLPELLIRPRAWYSAAVVVVTVTTTGTLIKRLWPSYLRNTETKERRSNYMNACRINIHRRRNQDPNLWFEVCGSFESVGSVSRHSHLSRHGKFKNFVSGNDEWRSVLKRWKLMGNRIGRWRRKRVIENDQQSKIGGGSQVIRMWKGGNARYIVKPPPSEALLGWETETWVDSAKFLIANLLHY
jgi:hypothetical protein